MNMNILTDQRRLRTEPSVVGTEQGERMFHCWAAFLATLGIGSGEGGGSPKSKVQSPRSKVQGPRSKVQGPRSKVQSPRSKVQSPKVQGPSRLGAIAPRLGCSVEPRDRAGRSRQYNPGGSSGIANARPVPSVISDWKPSCW